MYSLLSATSHSTLSIWISPGTLRQSAPHHPPSSSGLLWGTLGLKWKKENNITSVENWTFMSFQSFQRLNQLRVLAETLLSGHGVLHEARPGVRLPRWSWYSMWKWTWTIWWSWTRVPVSSSMSGPELRLQVVGAHCDPQDVCDRIMKAFVVHVITTNYRWRLRCVVVQ